MWKVIALIGFIQLGDANLLYSVQEYPTKVACVKAIPIFQKWVLIGLNNMVKAHGRDFKVAVSYSCIPSVDAYKPEAPSIDKEEPETPA